MSTVMGEVFTLGPLIIKKNWLILGLSVACGYLLFSYHLWKHKELREKISGLFTNALIWFLITWKLSPLLFRTSMFINDPIVLIYYRPGHKETLLALIITLGFLLYQLLKMNLSFYALFNALILISSGTAFIYYFFIEEQGVAVKWPWLASMLTHHPLHLYYMTLFLPLTMGLLYWKDGLESPLLYRSSLSLISIGQLGISLLKPYPYILGIQANFFWLFVLLFGLAWEGLYRISLKQIKLKNG